MARLKLVFCIAFCLLISNIYSQQKVGLVLSGGGAKGFAHIGVLKALEENNIPIDYITGTSMGAIIGGLYASGYTPAEIEKLILSDESKRWATGIIEPKHIYYFKKEPDNAEILNIDILLDGKNFKAKLPTNLIETHQLDFAAMHLFAEAIAAADYNFDSLFVPFRCVATDIYNNKEVVFKQGDLGKAIRASMTFPFFFKPIEIDNVLLFDGGMMNNFPQDIMISNFNPDFIIGSKTASNSKKPDTDDLFVQVENMLMNMSDYELPENGILIESVVEDVSLLDFDKAAYIIETGYNNTISIIDSIKNKIESRRSLDDLAYNRQKFNSKKTKLYFNNIYITGLNSKEKVYAVKSIYKKNSIISADDFKMEYFKLLADGTISSIIPEAKINPQTSLYDLNLKIKQKAIFNVGVGANISSNAINSGYIGLKYNHLGLVSRIISANVYLGRLYNSFQLTARSDFPTKIPFGIAAEYTINQWNYYKSSSDPYFDDTRPPYLIKNENNIKISLLTPIKINGLLKFSGAYGSSKDEYYQVMQFLKTDTVDNTEFNYYNLQAAYERNTLNYKQYPTAGTFQNISFNYLSGNERFLPGSTSINDDILKKKHNWYTIRFKSDYYQKVGKHISFGYYSEICFTNMDFFSNYTSTILNANQFQPSTHSKTLFIDSYNAHSFVAAGIKPIITITEELHLRAEIYAMLPYQRIIGDEYKNAVYKTPLTDITYMANAAFVYHTILGPASLSINYYDKLDKKYYFVFNFGYILFNKKGNE